MTQKFLYLVLPILTVLFSYNTKADIPPSGHTESFPSPRGYVDPFTPGAQPAPINPFRRDPFAAPNPDAIPEALDEGGEQRTKADVPMIDIMEHLANRFNREDGFDLGEFTRNYKDLINRALVRSQPEVENPELLNDLTIYQHGHEIGITLLIGEVPNLRQTIYTFSNKYEPSLDPNRGSPDSTLYMLNDRPMEHIRTTNLPSSHVMQVKAY